MSYRVYGKSSSKHGAGRSVVEAAKLWPLDEVDQTAMTCPARGIGEDRLRSILLRDHDELSHKVVALEERDERLQRGNADLKQC